MTQQQLRLSSAELPTFFVAQPLRLIAATQPRIPTTGQTRCAWPPLPSCWRWPPPRRTAPASATSVAQKTRRRPLPSVRELRRGAGPERDVGRALAVVVGGGARLEPLRVPYPVRKRIERGSASAHVSHAVWGWSSPKVRRPLGAFEHRTAPVCIRPAPHLSRTEATPKARRSSRQKPTPRAWRSPWPTEPQHQNRF